MDFELNGDQKEFQNVMRDFVNKEINPVDFLAQALESKLGRRVHLDTQAVHDHMD